MSEGLELDGYDIVELVGFGATGEVWRAVELASGDTVAIKRLRARNDATAGRLRREATMLATAAGPHVIGVRSVIELTDADQRPSETVLVLDYAPGGSLATILGVRGRLPAAEAVTVLAPLAAALASIHGRGLLHGDITPANILFTRDGRPLLADCGVAHALGDPQIAVEATPEYADPLVLAGGEPAAASDVYSLGAVGFAALTGAPPRGDCGDLPAALVDAPAALADAVTSALAADPLDRPEAADLARAVVRACAAAPVRLVTTPAPQPVPVTQPVPANDPVPAELEPLPAEPDLVRAESDPAHPFAATAVEPPEPVWAPRPRWASGRPATTAAWRQVSPRLAIGCLAVLGLLAAMGAGVAWAHVQGSRPAALPASQPVATAPTRSLDVTPATSLTTTPRRTSPTTPPAPDWRLVIGALDTDRDRAFARADPDYLDAVYAPDAPARGSDVTTLRSLASRGLHVVGWHTTAVAVRPIRTSDETARLLVTDEQSGYRLVAADGRQAGEGRGRGRRTFTVTLVRLAAGWRIAAIGD